MVLSFELPIFIYPRYGFFKHSHGAEHPQLMAKHTSH